MVVVDDTPRTVENLSKLLSFEPDIQVVGTALSAAAGIERVRQEQPDVLVMDVNLPDMDGIKATEQLTAELPLVPVILISVQEDREYLRRAMQAGARQYLIKPFSADELVEAVRRVHGAELTKRQAVTGAWGAGAPAAATPPPVAAAAVPVLPTSELPALVPPPAPPESSPEAEEGKIVVVFSGKGGVGKSVIAVNLAAALRGGGDRRVALVDLDLQFGDVAVLLGLEPTRTIADVVPVFPNVDGPFLGSLMPEAAGGLRVLAAPLSPELADLVTPAIVRTCLEILRQAFDFVVVDLSQNLNDVTLDAMERADQLLLVIDKEVPAIKDAKLAFRLFEHLGFAREKITLVLNRGDAPSEVSEEQIEATLRFPVGARIPSRGKVVLKSIQRATPVVISDPNSEIAVSIRELAGSLLPLPDAGEVRKIGRRRFGAFRR